MRRGIPILCFLLALVVAAGGCGEDEPKQEPRLQRHPRVAVPPSFFSPDSVWNERVDGEAPIDPSSAELVGALVDEVAKEQAERVGPWISTTSYSVPVYTVPADQPTVPVGLESRYAAPALRSALSAVPLPPGARPAAGSDGHLVVWQPGTDKLWEFWRFSGSKQGWQAAWAGAIEGVSAGSGVYGPQAWPGADGSWGASASGASIAGGLIRLRELAGGSIEHALAISLPQVRAGAYAAPATRTDGTSPDPLALPEGARLRIDPDLDLSRLPLPPPTRLLAEAAQRYGILVRDRAGEITFYGEDPSQTGENPYAGPDGYFDGRYPSELLAAFPWQHLQVLRMELRSHP